MSTLDPHPIEELVNSLIDGELTPVEEAEVRRRLDQDKDLAVRLQGIMACRTLVNSLPRVEAPVELLEGVRQTLERRSLLGEVPSMGRGRRIIGHLFARRLLAAAAAIILVGVLSILVYSILIPPVRSEKYLAIYEGRPDAPVGGMKVIGVKDLTGRLEARVASLADMEMFLNRVFEDHGLLDSVEISGSTERRIYRLHCGVNVLSALLTDLTDTWTRFDRPTFYLDGSIVVPSVTPNQLIRIAKQGSPSMSTEVAREIAVLNSVHQAMPGRDVLAAVVEKDQSPWPAMPKPVLTSSDKPILKKIRPSDDERSINLTMVLVAGK
jgi:hypothetical protein